jgi:hypothetical protein
MHALWGLGQMMFSKIIIVVDESVDVQNLGEVLWAVSNNIDPQRDEILLARNDRFWGTPAKPDQILFRRAGVPAALADSIRNGDTQVAQVHGGAAALAQLSAIPDVRTSRVITPRVMQLTLRAQLPKLADPVVRKAILSLLDVELLAAVGAGSDNSVTLDQSLVRAPSDPGYLPSAPEPLDRDAVLELFVQAGFRVDRSATESPVPPPPSAAPGTAKPESARGRISRAGLIATGEALGSTYDFTGEGIGKALESTGLAAALAGGLVSQVGPEPILQLAILYFTTMLLTELLSNNTSAVLMFPIALATAAALDVNYMPFIVSITIAASCGFATPIGYQTNLMVYGPGGYKFTDFTKVGLPLNIIVMLVACALIPVIWPL